MPHHSILKIISTSILLGLFTFSITNAVAKENEKYKAVSKERKAEIIKNIEENLHTVKTIKADFVQERHIALFLDVLRSGGVLYFERPDKLRWELKKPYRTFMIFNSNEVAKFRIEKGNLEKANFGMKDLLRGVLGQIITILKGDFVNALEAYNMEVLEGDAYLLKLTPKSASMAKAIISLELFFDPQSLHMSEIIIREPHDDFMKIIFSKQRINGPLKEKLFNIVNPNF